MQWLSVIPALATIIITFKTKKLVPALLTGITIGALLNAKSAIDGVTSIGNYVVGVLSDKGSAYALSFLILYGALSELISIPKLFIPAILFLISGAISYTIGSSWATWALMMPLSAAFSAGSGIGMSIMAGTVWAGGAVTDVVSPISAEMANIQYGKHFITALPYVVAGVAISTVGYIVAGFLIH